MSAKFHLTRLGNGKALLEPLAALNPTKPYELLEEILQRLTGKGVDCLYFDLGEMPVIDRTYYDFLNLLASGCRAANIRMICFNMQPAAAYALAVTIKDMPTFETSVVMPGSE